MSVDIDRLCALVVNEFAALEASTVERGNRDEALVRFALRALADPGLPHTAHALEEIDRMRANTLAGWIQEAA